MPLPQVEDDYSTVYCQDPKLFAAWFVENYSAIVAKEYEPGSYLILVIPSVASFKIRQRDGCTFDDHIALRVSVPMSLGLVQEFEMKGLTVVDGEKHWRIFGVKGQGVEYVGMIHLASRPSPLGTVS